MNNTYMRFLALVETLDVNSKFREIDSVSMRLLDEIIVKHAYDLSLTIGESMALKQIASPATIHRKLDDLKKLGLILIESKNNNRRTKFLAPTSTTLLHYKKLSNAMIMSLERDLEPLS